MSSVPGPWSKAATIAAVVACMVSVIPGLIAFGSVQSNVSSNTLLMRENMKKIDTLRGEIISVQLMTTELKTTVKELRETNDGLREVINLLMQQK